ELGVGNGRILIPVAQAGKFVIGVDSSAQMIELCRKNAATAGAADRLQLLHADFRDFTLPVPAAFIALPYDSIGHLVSREDKQRCVQRVFAQLEPGGRFILDYALFDRASAEKYERKLYLHTIYQDPQTRQQRMLWLTSILDYKKRSKYVYVWLDTVAPDGTVSRRL